MNYIISLFLLLTASLVYCGDEIPEIDILGIYSSGREVAGFSGTKLSIGKSPNDRGLRFEEDFYSDVKSDNIIEQDLNRGECRYINGLLIIARAHGIRNSGKLYLGSSISIYYPERVNGKIVLFREDSYQSWKTQKKVYDYGILVKVKDKGEEYDLKKEKLPVVRLSEIFGVENWKDPFVEGANQGK